MHGTNRHAFREVAARLFHGAQHAIHWPSVPSFRHRRRTGLRAGAVCRGRLDRPLADLIFRGPCPVRKARHGRGTPDSGGRSRSWDRWSTLDERHRLQHPAWECGRSTDSPTQPMARRIWNRFEWLRDMQLPTHRNAKDESSEGCPGCSTARRIRDRFEWLRDTRLLQPHNDGSFRAARSPN